MKHVNVLVKGWKSLSAAAKSMLSLAIFGLLVLAYVAWAYTRLPGAGLSVHNHTDRPIFSYFVNENWGGNAAVNGGGFTCCWRIEGDVLKVEWIKGRTGEQVRQEVQKDTVTLDVPNPPRTRQDKYLHMHFFPGDQVRLFWSPNLDSPYESLKDASDEDIQQ